MNAGLLYVYEFSICSLYSANQIIYNDDYEEIDKNSKLLVKETLNDFLEFAEKESLEEIFIDETLSKLFVCTLLDEIDVFYKKCKENRDNIDYYDIFPRLPDNVIKRELEEYSWAIK